GIEAERDGEFGAAAGMRRWWTFFVIGLQALRLGSARAISGLHLAVGSRGYASRPAAAFVHDRACRARTPGPLPAVRQRQAVSRISGVAPAMRIMLPCVFVCRFGARTVVLRHVPSELHCCRFGVGGRNPLFAAVLGACGAVGAADPAYDIVAAAPDKGPPDRVAISP